MAHPTDIPFVIVAVDGGAASGKSSLARALAARFHFLHVDTGSFYRTVTLVFRRRGVDAGDAAAVSAALAHLRCETRIAERAARLSLDGVLPAPEDLRGGEVNAHVSRVAAQPLVRQFLLGYQRGLADVARAGGFAGLVMEGRDIGSIIFPAADVKIFLTADTATRTRRRAAEGQADAVAERDRMDSSRATAPLARAADAVEIDSSTLGIEEVAARASELVEAARRAKSAAP